MIKVVAPYNMAILIVCRESGAKMSLVGKINTTFLEAASLHIYWNLKIPPIKSQVFIYHTMFFYLHFPYNVQVIECFFCEKIIATHKYHLNIST